MRNLYGHSFTLKPGTKVYVPTPHGLARGRDIKLAIEKVWSAPKNYYHLQSGGHVAAAKAHQHSPWLASVDLRRFFEHVTRAKLYRSLRTLRFSYPEAWEMACDSTVDKSPPRRRFSVPFGFVQSPLVASLVLSKSALGKRLRQIGAAGVKVSVYVDDITLSGDDKATVTWALEELASAAALSGFELNADKTCAPGPTTVSFNIQFGSTSISVLPQRMVRFAELVPSANEHQLQGIIGYVETVNPRQAGELTKLVP